MLVQCPQCRSLIDDDDSGDNARRGDGDKMHCPHCNTDFSRRYAVSAGDHGKTPEQGRSHPRIDIPAATLLAEGRPVAATGGAARRRSLAWTGANLLLLAVLVLQFSYFKRADVARHALLRPWVETLCAYTGCDLPPQRDLSRIRIMGRNVAGHPTVADALVVTVTLVNEAAFAQPYPEMELSFFDLNQKLLARRRFTAREYLPEQIDAGGEMTPGEPVLSTLEIVDPGEAAVNFELAFY